jgi:hypothetical protein
MNKLKEFIPFVGVVLSSLLLENLVMWLFEQFYQLIF